MRRKFEELRENLEEFVLQDEYPLLLVGCLESELAYAVKFLQGLEEKYPNHYFVVFPEEFASAGAYLDGVVANVEAQVAGANEQRAERGEPPFPPVPARLSQRGLSPAGRLCGVLDYLTSLLPNVDPSSDESQHHVVIGLLPLRCSDYEGYCALMHELSTAPEFQRSREHTRVVIYDDRSRKELVGFMRTNGVEHVLTFEVDLSTPALTDQLSKDASDPTLPTNERMDALLQLAALDYAYRRYPDALDKYGVLFGHYQKQGILAMQAMCLLGTGDTLKAINRPELAKKRLQQGIAVAVEDKALPVLINLFLSICGVCMELQHYEDAQSYADSGIQVAAAALNPFVYADFHELRGTAEIRLGRLADGLASYDKCKKICEMYEYFPRWRAVLELEREIYTEARMRREQRDTERQLAIIEEMERRGAASEPGACC